METIIGGQPTRAMVERAESWCAEHDVDASKAADLADVFSLWSSEFYQRGKRDAEGVPVVGELLTAEPFAVQLVEALEADPALAHRFRAALHTHKL